MRVGQSSSDMIMIYFFLVWTMTKNSVTRFHSGIYGFPRCEGASLRRGQLLSHRRFIDPYPHPSLARLSLSLCLHPRIYPSSILVRSRVWVNIPESQSSLPLCDDDTIDMLSVRVSPLLFDSFEWFKREGDGLCVSSKQETFKFFPFVWVCEDLNVDSTCAPSFGRREFIR